MKKILTVTLVTILLMAMTAMAGTLDLGFERIETEETFKVIHIEVSDDIGFVYLHGEYNYGKVANTITVDDGEVSVGWDRKINDKWSIWFDEAVGYDKISGVELENLAGVGPKYTIHKSDTSKSSFSIGYLHHYQSFFDDYGVTESKTTDRISTRIKYKRKTDHAETLFVAFYQPSIDDQDDYLASGKVTYSIRMTDKVYLKLSIVDEYKSIVPEGKEMNKLSEYLSLSFRFEG